LRPVLVERGTAPQETQAVRVTTHDGVSVSEEVLKRKVIPRPVFTLTLFNRETGHPSKVYDLTKAKRLVMRADGLLVVSARCPAT